MIDVIKIFLDRKLMSAFACMVIYTCIITYLFYYFGFWSEDLLKDTIVWFLFTGVISAYRAIGDYTDFNYFLVLLKDYIKLAIAFEFVVNFYTFSYAIEIVFTASLFFNALFISYLKNTSDFDKSTLSNIRYFVTCVNAFLILFIILHSVQLVLEDFDNFLSISTLKSFILPPIYSISFLGFVYFFVLWSCYEGIFLRIPFGIQKSTQLIQYIRMKIFILCHMNIDKLKLFWNLFGLKVLNVESKFNMTTLVEEFQSQLKSK